jgi:LuxR family transcriptional regulator, regulator of acetate metabolism
MSVIDEEEIHLVGAADGDAPSEDHDRSDAPADPVIGALLTDREREVMALMARGHNNAAIAERLVIREGTVKSHVKHILRKLGAANRAEAIARFLGHG